MAEKSVKRTREERLARYIDTVLHDKELECGADWKNEPEANRGLHRLAHPADRYEVADAARMGIETSQPVAFVSLGAAYGRQPDPEGLFAAITACVAAAVTDAEGAAKKSAAVLILFLAYDIKSSTLALHMMRSRQKEAVRMWKKETGCTVRPDYESIVDAEYRRQPVRLQRNWGSEMLTMPPIGDDINRESRHEADADVPQVPVSVMISVELFQMVELYNLIGEQLFRSNVRHGIHEYLDVDHEIERTLRKEPEYFYYKNNGITILTEDPDFWPKASGTITLGWLAADQKPLFSVINGAQTITTAARYFYEQEYRAETAKKEDRDQLRRELEKCKKTAFVPLRIICFPRGFPADQIQRRGKEISVALNRQKPMRPEDIAFTNGFVGKLVEYLEREQGNPDVFSLVKRGEKTHGAQMDLVEFARNRMVCAGDPGRARSGGAGYLLRQKRTEDGDNIFAEKTIFVPEWLDAEPEQEAEVFARFYGAVRSAQLCADRYGTLTREALGNVDRSKKDAARLSSILSNGRWYFTALAIQIRNEFSVRDGKPDYTSFLWPEDRIENEVTPGAMIGFARLVNACTRGTDGFEPLDSNTFKRSDLYQSALSVVRTAPPDGTLADVFAAALQAIESTQDMARLTAAQAVQTPANAGNVTVRRDLAALKGFVGKMAWTVQDILQKTHPDALALEPFAAWLTKGPAFPTGHGDSVIELTAGADRYYLKTHSDTRTKRRRVRSLCEALHVPAGEYPWLNEQ